MSDWLEFLNAYRASAHNLASFLLTAAIWRWGGSPERWLAGVFLATMVVPPLLMRLAFGPVAIEVGPYATAFMAIDILAAVLFTATALRANRNYPLWIAGFQLVAVCTDLVKVLVPGVAPLAVAILVIGPSYCQLLILLVGFLRHVRRERLHGRYRDWRALAPAPGALPL